MPHFPPASCRSSAARRSRSCSSRYASRERHPGHVDSERIGPTRELIENGSYEPLDLPGETIRIDTTWPVDLEALVERLRAA